VYVQIILTTLDMSGALPLLRIARIFRMLAVLRLYRVVQAYRGFDYLLGVLVFLILALIFVAAGIFQILEENYYTDQGLDPLMFHQAMYFVFVTLSTVGYGDISPHTTQGTARKEHDDSTESSLSPLWGL
jgi:voltage-gated potassium channel